MIDLHCHILPGVDDGPKTIDESLKMALKAREQGITHLMCTPIIRMGDFLNPATNVANEVAKLQTEFDRNNIELKLLVGQENRITGTLIEDLEKEKLLVLGSKNSFY